MKLRAAYASFGGGPSINNLFWAANCASTPLSERRDWLRRCLSPFIPERSRRDVKLLER